MSIETVLEARLRAKDEGLVGQLNNAERAATGVTTAMGATAAAGTRLTSATAGVAASQQDLAASANRSVVALANETRALDTATGAAARKRAGMQQLGFQAQDFFVQLGTGTPFMTAFSQQASQATGAIALMGGQVDGTSSKAARFAAFMGGPFGVALGVAIPLVALLTAKLFENGEASKEAEAAQESLSKRTSDMATFFDLATGAVVRNSQALIANARLQRLDDIDKIKESQNDRGRQIRDLVGGSMPGEVRFGGTFGNETGRATIVRSGPSDLVRAIDAAKGDQEKIGEALVAISRSGGANAQRAREILNLRGLATNDSDKLRRLTLEEESLRTKTLADELRKNKPAPRGRTRTGSSGAATALANFGEGADEKIARIMDGYNPAPRGLDKAFADLRALDGLIADLGKRKPPSFEKLIGEAGKAREAVMAGLAAPLDAIQQRLVPLPEGVVKAQAAIEELDGVIAVLSERKPPNWEELVARAKDLKVVAAETVNGPLNDMIRASSEQREQQLLILAGREREAEVLARIQQLTKGQAPLSAAQRQDVERMVAAEERINDLLVKRQDVLSIYSASIGELRGALEDLFSGGGAGNFLKNTEQMVKRLQGRLTVETLFGDSLRQLEKGIRGKSPLDREIEDLAREVDDLESEAGRSASALKLFTDALAGATADINRATVPGAVGQGAKSFLGLFNGARDAAAAEGDIVVNGSRSRPIGGTLMREQTDFLVKLTGGIVNPLTAKLDEIFGSKFFGKLGPAVSGGVAGLLTAGPVGGVLGALKELPGMPDKLKGVLGSAFDGAQTGTIVAGLGKALGLKTSTLGGQIGGAIGGAIPIPGMDIVGSVLGSVVGGLFKKTKRTAATITGVDSDPTFSGSSKYQAEAGQLAGSVQDVLKKVADALGGQVGAFNVSIGKSGDSWHVDPTGRGRLKKSQGGLDFGDDAQAAVMAAAFDAIGDGGITGLSAKVAQALRSSPDIDKAIREALKVQEVEEIITGLGGALEKQFRAFESQAKERLRIATQYGFDVSKIEARNAEDRAKMVEQILSSRVGSLQTLLQDLKFGDLFEGSAAERRDKLLTEISSAKADAEKGVDGAADRLADLSRQLVESSRDAYGTAGGEYAADRSGAISTAEAIIAAENERIRAAQQATVDTSKAMQTQNQLTNETNDILAEIRAQLAQGNGGGGSIVFTPRFTVERDVDLR